MIGNNISFKATFEGMDKPVHETLFERRTAKDTKHKLVFTKNTQEYGEDKFELFNEGKKTAEYRTEINENIFSMDRLMGIYNLLRAKEAKEKVRELTQHKK